MYKTCLKTFEISDEIFNKILYEYEVSIKPVKNFSDYMTGYSERSGLSKQVFIYDGEKRLIVPEYIVNYYCHNIEGATTWKQCMLVKVDGSNVLVADSINGGYCWNYIMKILLKEYTEYEIEECFKKYESEYSYDYKQFHYEIPNNGVIDKYTNCYKFDINGAHASAIIEIFPKAKKHLLKLYNNRSKNPKIKKYFNYFVGFMCKKNHRLTYNWVVQRTTKLLFNALDEVGGHLIYANTDGFVVKDPDKLLATSKELGSFKLEYSGDSYVYQDKNYWIIQNGDDITGSCLTEVRKYIDLPNNKVVHYKKVKHELNYFYADNIEQELLNESSK